MIVFADSSAIVTVYASAERDILPVAASVVASDLARVEVPSALWRKAALQEMTASQVSRVLRSFEADWNDGMYRAVRLGEALLESAAIISGSHGLRTLDAIQLACALAARDIEPDCRTMVALDERLRRAAATERFDILPA